MRERKLRSAAESLVRRFRESFMTYTQSIYKIKRKVKGKNTMRICSPSVPRLKHEWNHTVGLIINLRCGTADGRRLVGHDVRGRRTRRVKSTAPALF